MADDSKLLFRFPYKHLQLLGRSRPVLTQQSRQSPVGKQLSSRLTIRTVVGLVRGVADPLDLGAATRTGLFVSPVHRHPRTKCRNFLRKLVAGFLPQSFHPSAQVRTYRYKQPFDFFALELLRRSQRREPGLEENLIGVSVSDPAEQPRIAESP